MVSPRVVWGVTAFAAISALTRATNVISGPAYSFDLVNADVEDDVESVALSAPTTKHVQYGIRAGTIKARGVNLGGWLVAEKWMNPKSEIWMDVPAESASGGEYLALTKSTKPATTLARFTKHQANFIGESDIKNISEAGLNMVRVPVGYWITGEDPYDASGRNAWEVFPNGSLALVDKLIRDWALKYNVAVLLSIHGAKGSQSGSDHSAPTIKGKAFWSDYPENVNSTIYVSKFLADRYKDDIAFLGIGLLNEPTSTTKESVMTNYYERAYHAIRDSGNDCVLTVMPLLYKQKPESLKTFMEGPKYTNVWLEWHPYFIWGYQNKTATELLDQVISTEYRNKMQEWLGQNSTKKMFFGEWSLANAGQFKRANAESFEKYTQAQMKIMDTATAGWAYWSWRVEGDNYFNGWSMRSVLRDEPLRKIVLQ